MSFHSHNSPARESLSIICLSLKIDEKLWLQRFSNILLITPGVWNLALGLQGVLVATVTQRHRGSLDLRVNPQLLGWLDQYKRSLGVY